MKLEKKKLTNKERLSNITYLQVRCEICGRKLRNLAKGKLCSYCRSKNLWKEKYDNLKEETDRRFKLYDNQ